MKARRARGSAPPWCTRRQPPPARGPAGRPAMRAEPADVLQEQHHARRCPGQGADPLAHHGDPPGRRPRLRYQQAPQPARPRRAAPARYINGTPQSAWSAPSRSSPRSRPAPAMRRSQGCRLRTDKSRQAEQVRRGHDAAGRRSRSVSGTRFTNTDTPATSTTAEVPPIPEPVEPPSSTRRPRLQSLSSASELDTSLYLANRAASNISTPSAVLPTRPRSMTAEPPATPMPQRARNSPRPRSRSPPQIRTRHVPHRRAESPRRMRNDA